MKQLWLVVHQEVTRYIYLFSEDSFTFYFHVSDSTIAQPRTDTVALRTCSFIRLRSILRCDTTIKLQYCERIRCLYERITNKVNFLQTVVRNIAIALKNTKELIKQISKLII